MTALRNTRLKRFGAWLALCALLWNLGAPLLSAWAQSRAAADALPWDEQVCSAMGTMHAGAPEPAAPHAPGALLSPPHCPLCVLHGHTPVLPPAAAPLVIAAAQAQAPPRGPAAQAPRAHEPRRAHRTRAPPVFS
ncbi:DUF2946 domain-containing protein [Extensimonas sp. H3M7-6]|uniref:DUF2946 domain-containing protein n=1 Tax=Extensimonas soli TaxID=3031322 RepID=UPI0023DA8E89|nr:DUF2946 domain-containing protein [Extensimonas sp. H3M7-6]MDF1482400.1 DUF2946 domain-containing protein [Extensimonas sp. H3M7-6]